MGIALTFGFVSMEIIVGPHRRFWIDRCTIIGPDSVCHHHSYLWDCTVVITLDMLTRSRTLSYHRPHRNIARTEAGGHKLSSFCITYSILAAVLDEHTVLLLVTLTYFASKRRPLRKDIARSKCRGTLLLPMPRTTG